MNEPLANALKSLPHGPEFRFLERLLELEPGKRGVGEYTVRADEPFLRGHFPGNPILPGVLLVEACAQLAGIVVQSDPQRAPLAELRLTAIRNVKILDAVVPDNTIRLEAKIAGRMENLVQAFVTASVGDRLILQGDLTLAGRAEA